MSTGSLPQWKRELLQRRAGRGRPPPPSAPPAPPPLPPAVPSPPDEDEELRYGPGIVKRLKSRYLSLALRDAPRRRPSVLRRAASLEHLLDEPTPPAPAPAAVRAPRPASLAAPPQPQAPALGRRDFVKRARSVDALSRLERDEPPPAPRSAPNALPRAARPPRRPQPLLADAERPPPEIVRAALRKFETGAPRRSAPRARVAAVARPAEPEPRAAPAPPTLRHSPLSATNPVLLARAMGALGPPPPAPGRRVGVIRPLPPAPRKPPAEPPRDPPPVLEPHDDPKSPSVNGKERDTPDRERSIPSPRPTVDTPEKTSPVTEMAASTPKIEAYVAAFVFSPRIVEKTSERLSPSKVDDVIPEAEVIDTVLESTPRIYEQIIKAFESTAIRPAEEVRTPEPEVERVLAPEVVFAAPKSISPPPKPLEPPAKAPEPPLKAPSVPNGGRSWGSPVLSAPSAERPRAVRPRPPPAAAVSVVFNFSDRKDVPDYIENDGVIRRTSRKDHYKAGDPGVVLLAGARERSPDSEPEPESPVEPCVVRFVNDNVLINGKSSMPQRPNKDRIAKLKLQFDDSLTRTFEYPSETSLCEDDVTPSAPSAAPNANATHSPSLADNTHIVSAALCRYTPSKTQAQPFELGVTRHEPEPCTRNGTHSTADESKDEPDEASPWEQPSEWASSAADAQEQRSWSQTRALHTDLLF